MNGLAKEDCFSTCVSLHGGANGGLDFCDVDRVVKKVDGMPSQHLQEIRGKSREITRYVDIIANDNELIAHACLVRLINH